MNSSQEQQVDTETNIRERELAHRDPIRDQIETERHVRSLLGLRIHVLDHGYVELVDVLGSDRDVAQAAWISTDAESPGADRSEAAVRRVIRYMLRHRHTSPFEHAVIKLRVRVPMDCWRQWIRHRTMSVNEYSTRYAPAIDATARTDPAAWRLQDQTGNHQGSAGLLDERQGLILSQAEADFHARARHVYQQRLDAGVAREQARKDLPLSTYTEAYITWDLHNLLHFLELRLDSHAQPEIRAYAAAIADNFVKPLFPHTWDAFVDYRLEAVTFSRQELEALRLMVTDARLELRFVPEVSKRLVEAGCSKREIASFFDGLKHDG